MAKQLKVKPGPYKLWDSGYANSPLVLYVGDKAPNANSRHPLNLVDWIAEIKRDESPDRKIQIATARMLQSAPAMLAAIQAWQRLEDKYTNCEEHEPEMAPETCEECFPLADECRLKMRHALARLGLLGPEFLMEGGE